MPDLKVPVTGAAAEITIATAATVNTPGAAISTTKDPSPRLKKTRVRESQVSLYEFNHSLSVYLSKVYCGQVLGQSLKYVKRNILLNLTQGNFWMCSKAEKVSVGSDCIVLKVVRLALCAERDLLA